MNKIGIFGGSFNPVHIGHFEIAKSFIKEMNLDRLLLIPAAVSPFKKDLRNDIADNISRLEMLDIFVNEFTDNKPEIESYEIDKGGISYTADTVEYLRGKYPGAQLFLLIGGDHPGLFRKWRKWQYILSNVNICIIDRPGYVNAEEKNAIINDLSTENTAPIFLNSPMINISSSEIRDIIKKSGTINGLVPEGVEKYIYKKGLYR